jgi:NitT/TauT family transport system substrate-binding protein
MCFRAPYSKRITVSGSDSELDPRLPRGLQSPSELPARAGKSFFPNVSESVLADCIATYQRLGCWTPHVEITRAAYEKTLDVYEYNGLVKQRYRYDEVCAAPPAIR